MTTSRFWLEPFQNWQIEFFSIGMIVVLAVFLRQNVRRNIRRLLRRAMTDA